MKFNSTDQIMFYSKILISGRGAISSVHAQIVAITQLLLANSYKTLHGASGDY